MKWLVDLFVQVRASNLGQDAAIEIMIAILGIMIAILAIIAGIITLGIAFLGILGYNEIKRKANEIARKIAEKTAREVAKQVAEHIAKERREQAIEADQASALIEVEAESLSDGNAPQNSEHEQKVKATTDQNLRTPQ